MIRFACPVCHAAVEGQAPGDKMPCPSCGQRLQVPAPPVNKTVLGTWPPTTSAPPNAIPVGDGPPPKVQGEKFCRECGQPIREKAVVCPHCGVSQEGPARAVLAAPALPPGVDPHRGVSVMVLGIISASSAALGLLTFVTICALPFCVAALVTGIISWAMGAKDLRGMGEGTVDPAGAGQARAGYVCGIVGTLSAAATLVLFLILVIVLVALVSSPAYNPRRF